MIRLTLVLLAGIGVTLSVAGRDLDSPRSDVAVARANTDILNGPVVSSGQLALTDERGAIARALAATQDWEPVKAAQASENATNPSPATQGELASEAMQLAVINASRVNVRSGPSTANPVVDQLGEGAAVEIIGHDDDWAEIRVRETGTTAYVFDRFITPQG